MFRYQEQFLVLGEQVVALGEEQEILVEMLY